MIEEQDAGLSVKGLHAKRLFGMYNHDIILKPDHTTIVFGRNGAGKTVMFKLTHALLGGEVSAASDLLRYPYEEFRVVFSNGDSVLARSVAETGAFHVRLSYVEADGNEGGACEISTQMFVKAAMRIERRTPIHQVSPGQWFHPETSETMDAFEVVDRWGYLSDDDVLPSQFNDWRQLLKDRQTPQTLFIQAQRLIRVNKDMSRIYRGEERREIRDTVLEYSADLKHRIELTLAEYGREAQRLDQTYPQRLLGQTAGSKEGLLEGDAIQASLARMKQQQQEYQELGILGEQGQSPVATSSAAQGLNDEVFRAAMTLYVRDTEIKLEIVDRLAQRIQLLLTLIGEKFSNKKLKIHPKTHDLVVLSTVGKNKDLSVSALSSGEQHQLVLAYDLLFRTKANTLVLIDEPELSLHVEWQERFLSDLKAVIKLVHFDALLATHSPYIINGHDELMVGLSVQVD